MCIAAGWRLKTADMTVWQNIPATNDTDTIRQWQERDYFACRNLSHRVL